MTAWRGLRAAASAGLLLAGFAGTARAADPAEAAKTQAPPPSPLPAPAYEDRLIDRSTLPPETQMDGDGRPYNSAGWPRSWQLDTVYSNVRSLPGDTGKTELGLAFRGQIDTPDYGALSLDGRIQPAQSARFFTLSQRGMPFDGGWFANNSVGVVNVLAPSITRWPSRFLLPSVSMLGANSEWLNLRSGTELQVAAGEPGQFGTQRLAGFEGLGGQQQSVSGQWSDGPVTAAVQWLNGRTKRKAIDDDGSLLSGQFASGRSFYSGFGWRNTSASVRANLVDSDSAIAAPRTALWLDSTYQSGAYSHAAGLFRFPEKMTWGLSPINSDVQGAYYRLGYLTRRWNWDGGIEALDSVSGKTPRSYFGNISSRYQWDQRRGVGGGVALRSGVGKGYSAFAYLDAVNAFGSTRVQTDLIRQGDTDRTLQVSVDQAWTTSLASRMSTSLSVAQVRQGAIERNEAGVAGTLGTELTERISLNATANLRRSFGDYSETSVSANLALDWRVNQQWTLSLNANENRGTAYRLPVLDPLAPRLPAVPATRDRGIYVILRYQDRAGSTVVPLGGAAGQGAGTLSGRLFLDANENGVFEPSELTAANVTVLLDGRFATRTDSQGQFNFFAVAAGDYTITVMSDNLPLPWTIEEKKRFAVTIKTREASFVDIGATRLK